MRLLLPALALVLTLLCLSWWCYVKYALLHFPGDGFGNLPADAPAFMRQAKGLLGDTVVCSLPVYVGFLVALFYRFRRSVWPAKMAYLGILAGYPFLFFVIGYGFILW